MEIISMIMENQTVNWIIIRSNSPKSETDDEVEKHTGIINSYTSKAKNTDKNISFTTLLQHLPEIPLPEKWSFTLVDGEFLMFLKWNDSLIDFIKQIIILQTLEIKVKTLLILTSF